MNPLLSFYFLLGHQKTEILTCVASNHDICIPGDKAHWNGSVFAQIIYIKLFAIKCSVRTHNFMGTATSLIVLL